jgi:hypothetical protein
MAGTINTNAVLNNRWNAGGEPQVFTGSIAIDPMMDKQYDFALTDDPVALQESKDTQNKLYEIFVKSPYFQKYGGFASQEKNSKPYAKKVEKADIAPLFYYMKNELDKIKKVNIVEMILQINEFFDFNYNYIVNNVLTVPLKAMLYEEIYREGKMKTKMLEQEKLF